MTDITNESIFFVLLLWMAVPAICYVLIDLLDFTANVLNEFANYVISLLPDIPNQYVNAFLKHPMGKNLVILGAVVVVSYLCRMPGRRR